MTLSEQRTSDPAPRKRLVRRAPREELNATRAMARTARWARLARWYPLTVAIVGLISLAVMYGVYNAQAAQLKAARLKANPPATPSATQGQTTTQPTPQPAAPAPEPEPDLNTLIWPVTGSVSTPYGWVFSKTMQDWRLHQAIDLKAEDGTPVRAALAGTVASAGQDPTLGYLVVLDHGAGVQTAYGGLQAAEVKVGDRLEQNDYLGKVGSTAVAESADGPHLHFALTVKDSPVDPRKYLK